MKNIIILIGGGHAVGKKTVALAIKSDLEAIPSNGPPLEIEVLSMDKFLDTSKVTALPPAAKNVAISMGTKSVAALKPSRFDFDALKTHIRGAISTASPAQKLIIVHGLYGLYDKELCDMSHLKVYIDSDADTRLIRWIRRDVLHSGQNASNLETVINAYLHGAKQEMADFIFPTKERADVIMPRGYEANGIALIVDGILPYMGSGKIYQPSPGDTLRPFSNERFDDQKGKYYELT